MLSLKAAWGSILSRIGDRGGKSVIRAGRAFVALERYGAELRESARRELEGLR